MPRGIYTRKPFTKLHRNRISKTMLKLGIRPINNVVGKNSPRWLGDKVGYDALHQWIVKYFGNARKCENINCFYPRKDGRGYMMKKPKRYEWANISKKYLRDIKDYLQLCPSCHRKYDLGTLTLCDMPYAG